MITQNQPEYWQRGPVEGIPSLLQPVAHALLQARSEVDALMAGFPDELLWKNPADLASPAFHLQHLAGVIDRLFTYAKAQPLSADQLACLANEGKRTDTAVTAASLVNIFSDTVTAALSQLMVTPENSLTEPRGIGRKQIPTTVMGLLFHAAEHTQRHVGQLLVTVHVLKELQSSRA